MAFPTTGLKPYGATLKAYIDAIAGVQLKQQYGPAPSGDTSGVTDTAAIVAALAGMGKGAGLARPTTDPIICELGAGPYYINANAITVGPGQGLLSKVPGGTQVYCVGGSVGQAFITTMDASFSLVGTGVSSRGGIVSGLVLDGASAGAGTVGVRRGDCLNSRLDVTVMNFGGVVAATGAGTSVTVNGRTDSTGVTLTSSSPVVADTHTVIADLGTSVTGTGVPSGAVVAGVVKSATLVMGYSAPATANATASGTITLQVGWLRNDASITTTSGSNFIPDANAAAGDLFAPLFGTGIPLGAIVMGVDPGTGLYMGLPAAGVLYQNSAGWCERNVDHIESFNCCTHIAMDGTSTQKSFSYNELLWTADIKHAQRGMVCRGGAVISGVKWNLAGTSEPRSTTNNGVVLLQSETTRINGTIRCQFESSNVSGTTQAVPHFLADAGSGLRGEGRFNFTDTSPAPAWQASKTGIAALTGQSNSQIAFSGFVNGCWGVLSADTFGKAARTTIGYETKATGACPVAGSTVTVNWETGDDFEPAVLTSATSYTVVVDNTVNWGSTARRTIRIYFTQCPSGTAATVSWASWPGTIKWLNNAAAFQVNSTFSSVSGVELSTKDGGATWLGRSL